MSLFGGDSAAILSRASSAEVTSDFSISPIPSAQARRVSPPTVQYPGNGPDGQDSQDARHIQDLFTNPGESPRPSSLASYSQDDESEDEAAADADSRPKRFQGRKRTWRHYTHEERSVVASLDHLENSELNIHLYNAHAWKARLRQDPTTYLINASDSKSKWIERSEDEDKLWHPDRNWTLWPLSPQEVPREQELGPGGFPRKMEQQTGSRYGLEEQLYATTLRLVKEQWDNRPSTDRASKHQEEALETTESDDNRGRSPSSALSPQGLASSAIDDGSRSSSVEKHASLKDETDDLAELQDTKGAGDESVLGSLPIISADDARSRAILRPSVNHLLSRLDDLLMALHHNRHGQLAYARNSADGYDSISGSRSRSRSCSRSTRRSQRRSLKRTRSDQNSDPRASDTKGNALESDHTSNHTTKRPRQSKSTTPLHGERDRSDSAASSRSGTSRSGARQINPRDWSEVLGLAGMTGWDPLIVERAMKRCAALFGERMKFRVLDEHVPGEPRASAACPNATTDASELPQPNFPILPTTEVQGYRCPDENCKRHFKLFPVSQGYRFRAHLQSKHRFTKSKVKEMESTFLVGGIVQSMATRNTHDWSPPDPLICPHSRDCKRTIPFSETRRFIDHVKRTHKYDPRQQSPPRKTMLSDRSADTTVEPSSPEMAEPQSDDEMVGGVHNDGFLQPVSIRPNVRGKGKKQTVLDSKAMMD